MAITSPDGWFVIDEIATNVFAITESLGEVDRFGPVLTHSYVVVGSERAAIIDASHGIGDLRSAVAAVTSISCDLLLTHYHFDHIGCAHQFESVAVSELEASLLQSEPTEEMRALTARVQARCIRSVPRGFSFRDYSIPPVSPSRLLRDGDTVDLGARRLTVIHTPGHSPGSVCFLDEAAGLLFAGDTVNRGLITLSLELCDVDAYRSSLQRLADLGQTVRSVLPAHYATPVMADTATDLLVGVDEVLARAVKLRDVGLWKQADFDWFAVALPLTWIEGSRERG